MTVDTRARLAFIGCGNFATGNLCPNLATIPEIDLVAVCDLDAAKAERNARNFGARRWYTDHEAMLDQEELDGVFVIGPAPMQAALAPVVLARGLPIYVEKPSANTSAEAKALAELAEANGVWGQCGFMKRFAHVYTVAQDILADEGFGGVNVVTIQFGQGEYPALWGMADPSLAFLVGQCVHLFDLARYFGGNVARVQSLFHQAAERRFAYLVNVEYESGAMGQLHLTCYETQSAFRDIQERLEVHGLGCSVRCEDMRTLRYLPPEDWCQTLPASGPYAMTLEPGWNAMKNSLVNHGYHGEVRHFAQRCLGHVESGPDLWDSYHALRLAEAVYASGHGAGAVALAAEQPA